MDSKHDANQSAGRDYLPETHDELASSAQNVDVCVSSEQESQQPALDFPVVALGASAGGLEAFTRFFQALPVGTGMAFLLIQHLAPQHPSQLCSLLSRVTSMPVMEVVEGTIVEPDHVFVIPPNAVMTIFRGVLHLSARSPSSGVPMPINHFFDSLAKDQKAGAIAVVLSGTDSDGALGLQAIREEGGIAIAQDEDSAKFPGMPHSAVRIGPVDFVLPPEEIARKLSTIVQRRVLRIGPQPNDVENDASDLDAWRVDPILALLRSATGIDLRGYKRGTINRRIARRMMLYRQTELSKYASLLESDPTELMALYEDVLINVTSFFRDYNAFVALEEKVLPELLKNWTSDQPIRVWVPGCSTGEEVYSIAMCLVEAAASRRPSDVRMQFFGTDLSDRVLSVARTAIYQESQVAHISPQRRQRFFAAVPTGYQIVKSVRDLCVFAKQNVCVDPPFSRLDLISCRNLLIYLGPVLQQNVVRTFHYALQAGAFLMLGSSETLRGFSELFSPFDNRQKIFQRSTLENPVLAIVNRGFHRERPATLPSQVTSKPAFCSLDFERAAEQIILREYAPAWVIVNEDLTIVHTRGDTSPFLQLPAGAPSFELLKMVRENLRVELRRLLTRMKEDGLLADSGTIRERANGKVRRIALQVRRLQGQAADTVCFIVIFASQTEQLRKEEERNPIATAPGNVAVEIEFLREELAQTSQRLQAIIDERDATNQELTSANEEVQSSNEELQSINEELETAKEELQATNEELGTLNEELQHRNGELNRLGDDLSNLMSSTTIPILLLDTELRIRRMTPIAETLLGIRMSDLGRSVGDIRMRLSLDEVESIARNVLLTLNPEVVELQDREGRWRELRIRPYRTADNRIEGVVLVLIDIDQIRRSKTEATEARKFAESVIETVQTPLLVLRKDLRIRFGNRAFYKEYGLRKAEVEGQSFFEFDQHKWNLPGLFETLTSLFESGERSEEVEFESEFHGREKRNLCLHLHPVQPDGEKLILIAVENITARKEAARVLVAGQEELKLRVEAGTAALRESETALLQSRGELRELAAGLMNAQELERRRISRELHDDLSQKVAKLQFDLDILWQKVPFANLEQAKKDLRSVSDQTGALGDDLRRVAHGLHPSSLDHLGLAVALRSYTEQFSTSTEIPVRFSSNNVPREISTEVASCLYRIVQEALRNVAKHAPRASVDVILSGGSEGLQLLVDDDGPGFELGGLRVTRGLGLISMQERVRLVQGRFSLSTKPGAGVHISIEVPVQQKGANAGENTNRG